MSANDMTEQRARERSGLVAMFADAKHNIEGGGNDFRIIGEPTRLRTYAEALEAAVLLAHDDMTKMLTGRKR